MSRAVDAPDVRAGAWLGETDAITVLHVDDDGPLLEMAARFLERANDALDVHSTTDVEAAIDRVAVDDGLDCIVSDYRMPGTNGVEFLEAVREHRPDIPFILFTGEGSEAVAERAFSAGATDYFRKETNTDQYAVLAKRIESAVQQDRDRRTVECLTTAIDAAREGISIVDADGCFRYVNGAYADIFDYDREALLGEHWSHLYHEAEAERVREEVLATLPAAGTWRGETVQRRADGSTVVTDHVLATTGDGSLICSVREASDRAPSRPAAASTDTDVPTAALDPLEDLLFVIGPDGTLQSWNDSVPEVTGRSPDALASSTPADLVVEADADRMTRFGREPRTDGDARVEARLRTGDGDSLVHEFISETIRDDDGDVLARIGLGRDIATRTAHEQRTDRQTGRLDRLAGIGSHDLRNPLFAAREQFRRYQETGDREAYDRGQRELARIEPLITDLLAPAQTGDGIHLETSETVDLERVADRAWSLIDPDDTTLTVEATTTVEADESRLRRLLETLFRTAIEHGGTGGSIRVGPLSDRPGFFVADDGPGIPPADRELGSESGHSTSGDGTGFGPATVDLLVDAHGWTVDVTESDADGTRFEVAGIETEAPDA